MNSSFLNKVRYLHKRLQFKFKTSKYSRLIVISAFALAITVLSFSLYSNHEISTRACMVYFGGEEIGYVRDKDKVADILKDIEEQLSKECGLEIVINEKLQFEDFHAEDKDVVPYKEIEQAIKSNLTFDVLAYTLEAEGRDIAILKSKEEAENIIEKVKEPYINMMEEEGSKIEDVRIVEDLKIVKKEVSLDDIQDFDKVLAFIQKGTDEVKIHKIEKGESYWSISHKYNLSVEDLEKANPGKDPEKIYPGDELSLIVPKPYLTVATYEEKKIIEDIKYEVQVEKTDSLYSDEWKVKKSGKFGKKEITAKIEKYNGIEVGKEILKEVILSQPVTQIVLQGTKTPPPKKGTGVFVSLPTRGTLTSRFGIRWGRMHNGIDLAARVGTAIKAADGGVVTFAGLQGTYGYMVEIDHGGGFKTRYGHCSKIYVKKGEKVYKGKTIAAVGNTGRSTGPHLHFEVRKYDVPQNPYNYLGKQYR